MITAATAGRPQSPPGLGWCNCRDCVASLRLRFFGLRLRGIDLAPLKSTNFSSNLASVGHLHGSHRCARQSTHRPEAVAAATPPPPAGPPVLKIATFNIKVFGPTKASHEAIVAELTSIIVDYDVIAIQEIKDSSGEAPRTLLQAVNLSSNRTYGMMLSPRTGLQPDDKASQEQYAVLYDMAVLEAQPGDRLFDDEKDLFQREPYLTPLRTRAGELSFVLIDIHTPPESASAEIAALHEVVEWAKNVFEEQINFLVLGDFNAGCDYVSPDELARLDLRGPSYFWIVPDDSDSNVSPNSACAYDRIVTTAPLQSWFAGRWGVGDSFNDSDVSDHWPVWAEFSTQPLFDQNNAQQ
jgi:deoxyribonuclease-1-like protein